MKKITVKEQLSLIRNAQSEIYKILDQVNDSLVRIPTIEELNRWHIEINRGILLAKSKVHRDEVLTLSDLVMVVIERYFKLKEN